MRNIIFITWCSLVLILASFTNLGLKEYQVDTVIIDAGHGGKDPGSIGKISEEKEICLKIALKVGQYIEENIPDVKVIYTRNDDTFIPLNQRPKIANRENADVFLSIHANAVNDETVHGTESFVMGPHTFKENLQVAKKENSVILMEDNYRETYEGFNPESPESDMLFSLYQYAYLTNSLKLANNIQAQFKRRVKRKSRGVKQAGFWVLYRTSMPSVLIEVGFLSNNKEEQYLNDELGQTYIASGIFRAFRNYKEEIESMN